MKSALKNLLRSLKFQVHLKHLLKHLIQFLVGSQILQIQLQKRDSTFNEKIAENRTREQGQQGGGEPVVVTTPLTIMFQMITHNL